MREFIVYTLSRLGLFVVAYAIIAAIYLAATGESALPVFWPLLVAIIVSSVASVYLLRGQRERFAAVVERRAAAGTRRAEERGAAEQAEAEQAGQERAEQERREAERRDED